MEGKVRRKREILNMKLLGRRGSLKKWDGGKDKKRSEKKKKGKKGKGLELRYGV